jgi:hypothetical protein
MHIPKKYFHDRIILLFISSIIFFAVLNMVLILLGITSGNSLNLVQYRPNLGLNAYSYETNNWAYINFIIFGYLVAFVHIFLSMKVYIIRRYYSITVLATGLLLLILSILVSNALLVRF